MFFTIRNNDNAIVAEYDDRMAAEARAMIIGDCTVFLNDLIAVATFERGQ